MRGLIGGILTGGLVSVVGLGAVSVMSELPAGTQPPEPPLVDAPMVDPVAVDAAQESTPNTPVGSISIQEPTAPELPDNEAALADGSAISDEPDAPQAATLETQVPLAGTDPLDEPEVSGVEGTMEAPETQDDAVRLAVPVDPVLPNPQALAPQTPETETDLTVSTSSAQPVVVVEPDADDAADMADDPVADTADTFVVDLGVQPDTTTIPPTQDAPIDSPTDDVLASVAGNDGTGPRLQLQGGENALLGERATGVTVRRPGNNDTAVDDVIAAPPVQNALADYAAFTGDTGGAPLMSIVLIDDGSMSAAAAALSGLPFAVTIALDPGLANATELMQRYRANGFEVVVLAKLPEGALPSDVEVTFESIFRTLPETVAVLDIGESGLQTDRAVTQQAMAILASQGRGFASVSQGLNMAGRAAEQAGVPAVVVFRDLDSDGQDARIVRRFVDQAAFRARQESGVVLVGRVRPDTISALILWGTANQTDQVAIVPLSAVLLAQ